MIYIGRLSSLSELHIGIALFRKWCSPSDDFESGGECCLGIIRFVRFRWKQHKAGADVEGGGEAVIVEACQLLRQLVGLRLLFAIL